MQHPDGGVVAEILVDEGDTVENGDVLIRLDPRAEKSELSIIQGQLFELMARRGRLIAERDNLDRVTFDPKLIAAAATDPAIDELKSGQEQLFHARRASLTKQVEQLRKRTAQIDNQIDGIIAQKAALNTQLDLIEIELDERAQALVDRLERMDIRAPASGIVHGLTVFTPRSVIHAAEPVMYLIPQDRPLIFAAQVSPINIDELFVSQNVTLRFSALDQRKTPELFGKIVKVSADAFVDEATRATYYRAEIILNDGQIDRLPAHITLIPGMPGEAFIRTSDRSPLSYLVKPLTDYFAKAFQEG